MARFSLTSDEVAASHHALALLAEAARALAAAGVTRFGVDLAAGEGASGEAAGLDALIRLEPERVGFVGGGESRWARERLRMAGYGEAAPGQYERRPTSTAPAPNGDAATDRVGLGPGAPWRVRGVEGANPEASAWRAAVSQALSRAS